MKLGSNLKEACQAVRRAVAARVQEWEAVDRLLEAVDHKPENGLQKGRVEISSMVGEIALSCDLLGGADLVPETEIVCALRSVRDRLHPPKRVKKIPKRHPVQPLAAGEKAQDPKDEATCGHCGLRWDDGIVTGMTPTPSGRRPFEDYHVYPEE